MEVLVETLFETFADALLSALARPQNLEAYGEPDAAALAAAYAFGVARNPVHHGNPLQGSVLPWFTFLRRFFIASRASVRSDGTLGSGLD